MNVNLAPYATATVATAALGMALAAFGFRRAHRDATNVYLSRVNGPVKFLANAAVRSWAVRVMVHAVLFSWALLLMLTPPPVAANPGDTMQVFTLALRRWLLVLASGILCLQSVVDIRARGRVGEIVDGEERREA